MNKEVSIILGSTKGLGKYISEECQKNGEYTIEIGSSILEEASNDRATLLPCDLSNLESVNSLIDRLNTGKEKPITNFYWVAGQLIKGEFKGHNKEDIIKTIDVNFRNSVLIAHYIWSQMLDLNSVRRFVVISSSSGIKARADEAIYAATKHAQVGFTRSLGLENTDPNLRVSLIMPGGMQTPFWDKNPNPDFDTFLDPKKVAKKIFEEVRNQTDKFIELEIPRGSL